MTFINKLLLSFFPYLNLCAKINTFCDEKRKDNLCALLLDKLSHMQLKMLTCDNNKIREICQNYLNKATVNPFI